jgi:ATP-binding cassette subfamily C protein CydC
MDGGQIVEQGDHLTLMRQQGRYAHFRQRISGIPL